ncbi:MAG: hypothetical protein IJ449_13485 [Clostridia bacterium]|nr:hypothetical protein [Clostridia bacterium]
MKRYLAFMLTILVMLTVCACQTSESINPVSEESEILYEVKTQSYTIFNKSLEECVEEADYIVYGTVSEIETALLETGYTLSVDMIDNVADDELVSTIRKIYTPISFVPQVVYKTPEADMTAGEFDISESVENSAVLYTSEINEGRTDGTIPLRGRYGEYNGFKFSANTNRVLMEEGKEYILFLYVNNQGTVSVWHQPSILINEDGTYQSLMNNQEIYSDFDNIDEIITYFESLMLSE